MSNLDLFIKGNMKIHCINRMKKKKYVIISGDTENVFDKIQYLFMI